MDVIDQIIGQLGDACVKGPPSVAGIRRGRVVIRHASKLFHLLSMTEMLVTHDADWLSRDRVTLSEHRKQYVLLFGHVIEQLCLHFLKQISQTNRNQRVLAVNAFNAPSHADQLGNLLAVNLMVTLQNMVDQRAGILRSWKRV